MADTATAPAETPAWVIEDYKLVDDLPTRREHRKEVRVNSGSTSIFARLPIIGTVINSPRHQLLQEIGLFALADAEVTLSRMESTRVLFPELVHDDTSEWSIDVWARFLPTLYSLENYTYDSVPEEVLKLIRDAQQLGCFDRILIVTPENNRSTWITERSWNRNPAMLAAPARDRANAEREVDPMAIGIIDGPNQTYNAFAIARWGESLAPFGEIKKFVRNVSAGSWWERNFFWAMPASVVGGICAVGAFIANFDWLMTSMR